MPQPVGHLATHGSVYVAVKLHVLEGMTVVVRRIQAGRTHVAVLKYGHGMYAVEVTLWQVVQLGAGVTTADARATVLYLNQWRWTGKLRAGGYLPQICHCWQCLREKHDVASLYLSCVRSVYLKMKAEASTLIRGPAVVYIYIYICIFLSFRKDCIS